MPDDYFDTLGGRIEARLDSADLEGEAMGPNMTTDGGKKNDMPPPGGQPGAKREENTGLHDIKAMATSTRKRISRRMSTESDHEESLLASASSASLAAVVLPEPGKDKEHFADEGSAAPRAAAASTAGLAAAESERTGMPLWIYGVAGAAVAAAAIIFFVVRSGHENKTEVAQSEAATGSAATTPQPEETPAPAPTASSIPQPAADQAAEKDVAPPAEDPNGSETGTDKGSSADTDVTATNAATPPAAPPTPAKQDKAAHRSSRSRHSSSRSTASSSSSSKRASSRAPAAKSSSHTSKSKPKKSSDGKRSLDDLLDEASGGAVANSDVAPTDKPAEAKKPTKTELSRSDITGGMRKINARVSACYSKYQEAGTVMVKVTISPDGHVASASATGKFKNTETGLCVAQAVEKAKFPAWDGKPQHINYPFLLSP